SAYPHLAEIANKWAKAFGEKREPYPADHSAFLKICHRAGQTRPTPLVLHYEAGDYNCLHQDLYGPLAFPLQVVIGLSRPRTDYRGGELMFVEQRPRAQSRATAVVVSRGEGIVFTNRERPVAGKRGDYRVQMRHGASVVSRGRRLMLGI